MHVVIIKFHFNISIKYHSRERIKSMLFNMNYVEHNLLVQSTEEDVLA